MSHIAMNWALTQRHLKPGPWIVLIQLADRHNKDTKLCRPEQTLLALDCNMSRATLNRHLAEIEQAGLIRRVTRMNPATRKQLATQYILEIDFDTPPDVDFPASQFETRIDADQNGNEDHARVSNCDTETVSQKSPIPCLKNRQSRVSNRDTSNPVREPKNEPSAHGAREDACEGISDDDFERFWAEFPAPVERDAARKAFAGLIEAGKVCPEDLIIAASRYAASDTVRRGFVMKPANWLARGSWRDEMGARKDAAMDAGRSGPTAAPPPADMDELAELWAEAVKAGRTYCASSIKPAVARHMLSRQLVTETELRRAGVTL